MIAIACLLASRLPQSLAGQSRAPALKSQGLMGYIGMNSTPTPDAYDYGVSLYAAAWPLVEHPLRDFQIGLASIWIVPDNRKVNYPLLPHGTLARDNWPERGPSYRDVFQTIEGGLGFWGNTRYWTAAAKFRMNGTANGYNHEISTPGWGFGGGGLSGNAQALQADQMGIAQLSSRILAPPDGLTFRKGTCGELLGYAWMALPLTLAKSKTAGFDVPTGDQSWTLFLNTKNFRGPVAFYIPATWSRVSRTYAPAAGRGLDSRPGVVTGGAIEVNTVPRFTATAASGVEYARIPRLQFPTDAKGRTILIHNLTHYSKAALFDRVAAWLNGGPPAKGRFDLSGAVTPRCKPWPLSVKQGASKRPIRGVEDWVSTSVFDGTTFGLQWNPSKLVRWKGETMRADFPEYFRQDGGTMNAIPAENVPKETGLEGARFKPANDHTSYTSPPRGNNVWYMPGPAAGPFRVTLADGSVVTYYWYKFIDQPSLQDADLSDSDKARLQRAAEKIQAEWTPRKEYMAPPKLGTLASLDPAILVRPPKGLEIGYVPIAVRQDPSR